MDKTFFDVRVFHPGAASNRDEIKTVCGRHEAQKKREYGERIVHVEKASFTPLVFSTSGVTGNEAEKFHRRLATLLSKKRNTSYSDAISYVRRKLRFCLLRSTLAAVRGYRGCKIVEDNEESDINIIPSLSQVV